MQGTSAFDQTSDRIALPSDVDYILHAGWLLLVHDTYGLYSSDAVVDIYMLSQPSYPVDVAQTKSLQ